jgi:hypothetical protein
MAGENSPSVQRSRRVVRNTDHVQISLPASRVGVLELEADVTGVISQNAVSGQCTSRRLIRPISARSIAAARRVTQDYARPFCTVQAATATGFCGNPTTNLGSRPARASMAFSRKTARTKKRNEDLSIGP